MKTVLVRRLGLRLLAGLLVVPLLARAQAQPKVVTLGADLNEPQRQALLARFGVTEGVDTVLTITTPEMVEAMQNIIPIPEGYTSVSSTALTCAAPGSGLHVTTENITRVTAGMYAGALLTAGIGDAELVVAAPVDAAAEGMTALTGVFKGFVNGACGRGEVDPARRELAYRWLGTTAGLGNALGDQNIATRTVLRAQQAIAAGGTGDPALADQALNTATTETGANLPPEQREAVLDLLRRMAQGNLDWGAYASGWEFQEVAPNDVRLQPRGIGLAPSGGTPLVGSVRTGAGPDSPLVIDVPGQTQQLNLNANNVAVTRDGQPAQLADLQPGDSITMELGEDQSVRRIDARSAGGFGALGRIVVGTVEQNNEGQVVLATAGGPQEFGIPAGAYVAREGRQDELGAIKSQDSAVIVLDPAGAPTSVFASPTGGDYAIEGTLNGPLREQVFAVRAGSHNVLVPVPESGVKITRDGKQAALTDIQPNDRVRVRFNAQSQPVAIDARSGSRSLLGGRWWLLLLPLLLLLLLLPLLRRRRPGRSILVLPGRRRRTVNTDDIDGLLG